ncbi:kynureninase [Taibaiella sp. KBW10]|uniref:kynureninase n=1 Tax=Taibaiella sp. KBW10 TaxID=2153357 RepID=UPI000F59810C|nr:kynureninase [Taibaiella sp. KBW10]RQO32319.1 kynureninase [Taibaiella sp. KBW10]
MSYTFENNLEYALSLDDMDILHSYRERFHFPQHEGEDVLYFCGNSLGLQPRSASWLFQKELADWAKYGVEGHFQAENPWMYYHSQFSESLARIVGADVSEVVAMNTLTVNLHLLMISFYRPTATRYKIIMEAGAFPSDQYAIETQVVMHGFNPNEAIIELTPRAGEHCLRDEDILQAIADAGDSLACVMMGAVNYYTGQWFNMPEITKAAHAVGALCGFDLAHAMGNVPMHLHDWDVDFACWCSYKYLNSGPGGVAGIFVHQKHGDNPETFRLAGWWGNEETTRFKMKKGFVPAKGAASWQMSNAPVFNMIAHKSSLDIFDKTSIDTLREKSLLLTAYTEYLLKEVKNLDFEIITPEEPQRRGAQLSLLFKDKGRVVFDYLTENGVVADWREPNVIRIAPVPMYNSFEDVYRFVSLFNTFPG